MELVFSRDICYDFIEEILLIDTAVYSEEMRGTYTTVNNRYQKNRDSYILVRDAEMIVGYFCFFPITDKLYNSIYNSNDMFDDNIEPEEICEYTSNNNLFFISAAILPKYQNKESIKYLINGFKQFLREKNKMHFSIDSITATSVSIDGEKLLSSLLFEDLKSIVNGYHLYFCNDHNVRRLACYDL